MVQMLKRTTLLTLIGLLSSFSIMMAQDLKAKEDSALVKVHVTNFDGNPHQGITIHFVGKENGKTYKGKTDENGRIEILLPEGETYQTEYEVFDRTFDYQNFKIPAKRGRYTSELKFQIEPPKTFTLENVHFKSGKATLQKTSYEYLNEMVELLQTKQSMRIEIAGHTDNVGSKEENMTLSKQRAQSVKEFLVEKGIDPGRVTTKGYGATQPVATNKSVEGRQKNRRTEVRILER